MAEQLISVVPSASIRRATLVTFTYPPPRRRSRAIASQRLEISVSLAVSATASAPSLELDEPSALSRARHRQRLLQSGVLGKREHGRAVIRPHASRDGDGCAGEGATRRAPRFLCLHGFRTSGEIMRRQVAGKWPAEVTSRLDLAFADAPFPAEGESPVGVAFDPPYYEWCQFVGEDFLKYRNFGKCLANVEELMVREGPFDGLLGFSQGGLLSAVLVGLQEQGLALNRVPKVKYVMVISGAKIHHPALAAKAYRDKIRCPSLHFIGDNDFVKTHGEELVDSFVDPLVIRHPAGHTVPKLDDKGLKRMLSYLDKIERDLSRHSSTDY